MPGPHGRYSPLRAYLDALPSAEPWVQMSFVAIEALLGHPLPASASSPGYWTHTKVAAGNWWFALRSSRRADSAE